MRVVIITEGRIDDILLPPLIQRIAYDNGITWPLDLETDYHIVPIRKAGHGGVKERIVRVINNRSEERVYNADALIAVLDYRKTQETIAEIKRTISSFHQFVLGIAKYEIEAWWLADQTQTLAWLNLTRENANSVGYDADYAAEHDEEPKKTLNLLTTISDKVEEVYGDGNAGLAEEFVDEAWYQNVNIEEVKAGCPEYFREFYQRISAKCK